MYSGTTPKWIFSRLCSPLYWSHEQRLRDLVRRYQIKNSPGAGQEWAGRPVPTSLCTLMLLCTAPCHGRTVFRTAPTRLFKKITCVCVFLPVKRRSSSYLLRNNLSDFLPKAKFNMAVGFDTQHSTGKLIYLKLKKKNKVLFFMNFYLQYLPNLKRMMLKRDKKLMRISSQWE